MAVARKLLAVALGLLLAGMAAAQDKKDDLVDRAAKEREVAKQALEQRVQSALDEADKQADKAKAEEQLRDLLKQVEADDELSIVRKVSLAAGIKERLERLRNGTNKAGKEPGFAADREDDQVREKLDQISELRKQGRLAEAQRAAEALARQHPNNTVAKQVRNNLALADAISEAGRTAAQAEHGTRTALSSPSKSAIPIAGDIQYPSKEKWAEINKRPAKWNQVPLTEKEQALLKSLAQALDERIDLKDQPLDKVLEYLQKLLGAQFRVDKKAIDDLNLTYETPISVSLPRGLSKRTILRRILNDVGLTYIIKDEGLMITSVEMAQKELTTRTYQIDDLLGLSSDRYFRSGVPGPGQMDATVRFLVDLIQSQIDPHSWEKSGGPGSITFFAPTRTLIVKQTAEVHALMSLGFAKKK